jgi:hypothetical protein
MAPQATVDLISARGGQGTLILHLSYPDHRARYPEGIDAVLCFNLAEKVLASYMLKAKRWLPTGRFIKDQRQHIRFLFVIAP